MFRLFNLAHAAPLTSRSRTVYAQVKRCSTRSCLEIEEKLREKFEKFKPIEDTPLYRDFDTYKASLPVRERKHEWLKLHELPYFGADDDVQFMAEKLYDTAQAFRRQVMYVCAPAASGKTTSVLPAFLESKFFTHYLYIAFDNNNDRQFQLSPYKPMDDTSCAEEQGAAFAYECVRKLVQEPDKQGPHKIKIEVDGKRRELPTEKVSVDDKLKTLLGYHFGEQSCILFHVDEHRKMCERGDAKNDPGASFARGAMQTLAKVGIVVATYTDPPSVPALGSSGVCRSPVFMPQVDIQKILQHLQLSLPHAENRTNDRLLTMLKFRLAMAFQPSADKRDPTFALELGGLHRLETASPQLQDFVGQLRLTLENKDRLEQEKVIEKCIKLCAQPMIPSNNTEHAYATQLLLGMSDKELEKAVEQVGRGINDLVVLKNEYLTTTLLKLLSLEDADSRLNAIYMKGCARFRRLFNYTDLLCALPLEEAYLWTISCRSAVRSALQFPLLENAFEIRCTDIKPARIFPTQSSKEFDVTFLEPHVMYYADEPGRGDHDHSHPCADMFFRTADDELVLIEITGSANSNKADQKAEKLRKIIPKMQKALRIGEQMETHDLSHMHTHMQTYAHLQAQTHSCTQHAHTLTYTHTRMHTSHMHTYTHTHMYTDTLTPGLFVD